MFHLKHRNMFEMMKMRMIRGSALIDAWLSICHATHRNVSRDAYDCLTSHLHMGAIRADYFDGFALFDGLLFVGHGTHVNVSRHANTQALSELISVTVSRGLTCCC